MKPQPRPARLPCRINLPTLVVQADAATAELIAAILASAGIPDADLATSAEEAERRFGEREYSAIVASDALAGALLPLLAPDEDGDRTGPALVVTTEHGLPLGIARFQGAPVLSRLALPTHLVPCLQAALAELGIRCKSHRFCGQRSCAAGF